MCMAIEIIRTDITPSKVVVSEPNLVSTHCEYLYWSLMRPTIIVSCADSIPKQTYNSVWKAQAINF